METVSGDLIICRKCNFSFARGSVPKHCSNCFACTGCEIYYCPVCDSELVIKPVRKINPRNKADEDLNKKRRKKK